MTRPAMLCVVLLGSIPVTFAQNPPHVADLMKSLDANKDGSLSSDEVANNAQYARQFPRWDADGDGKVSRQDIIRFRAKFGIQPDGTRRRRRGIASAEPAPFTIPDLDSVPRVGKGSRLDRAAAANSQFILKTTPHAVDGTAYVIITDHTEAAYLQALRKLAIHRHGKVIRVADLATLHEQVADLKKIRGQLVGARYVAVAPKLKSFRENMVLGMWQLLSTLDHDPQLDCFPGFLVASNPDAFARLINQSIGHTPITAKKLKPFAINQVQNSRETRSLQKSGILRNHFQKAGLRTPVVAIYGQGTEAAPRLKGERTWNLTVGSRRKFVKSFAPPINAALAESNLIVMHGHGIPGMSCSMDVDALPDDCRGKVLLSGSCFSASPIQSDLAAMNRAPGGYEVKPRDAFILRAIDNGAIAAFGHQRLSSGFPHLYPVLESWLRGESVGQGYQQLINGLIDQRGTPPGGYLLSDDDKSERSPQQQRFLYVVIGDPALKPFERVQFSK